MITFFILQIANAMGVNSVNIVRDRPNIDELKNYLKDLGATIVVTEKELRYDFFISYMIKFTLLKHSLHETGVAIHA